MTGTPRSSSLYADRPATELAQDRLGYAGFAMHMARAICDMSPPEGYVIAIHGPWGSGKSSLIEFILRAVEKRPKQEQPIVLRFNPWWFSGEGGLVRQFVSQLKQRMTGSSYAKKNIRQAAGDFLDIAGALDIPVVAGVSREVSELLTREEDPYDAKQRLAKLIKKSSAPRILVVMDDVDRLEPSEACQLFRTIKAICDLPNVVYLLAFDRARVAEALTGALKVSGDDYLRKIVQLPVELPLPSKNAIRRLLFESLEDVFGQTIDTENTSWYRYIYIPDWENPDWQRGLEHFVRTPRDVNRLANALQATYEAVKREVNPVDFLILEVLRQFCPAVYDIIRNTPTHFAGSLSEENASQLRQFHEGWLAEVDERDRKAVIDLVYYAFPGVQELGRNAVFSARLSAWRRDLRVCSPQLFDVYFRLAVPDDVISKAEIDRASAKMNSVEGFADYVAGLTNDVQADGTTRASMVMERLQDYVQEIPESVIPNIVTVLFQLGDQILLAEKDRLVRHDSLGADLTIGSFVLQLLMRLDEDVRFRTLRQAISDGEAITTICGKVAILGMQHGKYASERAVQEPLRTITPAHLEELESLALQRIREAVASQSLHSLPSLSGVLFFWSLLSPEEAKAWAERKLVDDAQILPFLAQFITRCMDPFGSEDTRLETDRLGAVADLERVGARLRELQAGNQVPVHYVETVEFILAELDKRAHRLRSKPIVASSALQPESGQSDRT